MHSLQEIIKMQDSIISEVQSMFGLQTKYFTSQDTDDLVRLRNQSNKVKALISDYKKARGK